MRREGTVATRIGAGSHLPSAGAGHKSHEAKGKRGVRSP